MLSFDLWLFHLINQRLACPALDAIMPWVTWLGRGELEIAALLLFMLWRWRDRPARSLALLCLIAVAAGGLAADAAKLVVKRDRPAAEQRSGQLVQDPSGNLIRVFKRPLRVTGAHARMPSGEKLNGNNSFPSGHTATACALAFVIGMRRRRWAALVWALAAAVAFSRVYLGLHWPTDVLGAATIGVLSAWAVLRIAAARARREGLATGSASDAATEAPSGSAFAAETAASAAPR